MGDVLLTVSGVIDPQIERKIAEGQRPRADYLEMAQAFGADLIDYGEARRSGGWWGRLLERAGGPHLLLAWACFTRRGRYRILFTDGEQVGIPLALLLKLCGRGPGHVRHLMIAHILSVEKKMRFFDWLRVHSHIDTFFVYSTWQKRFVEERWRVPPARVVLTPFMVDAGFFCQAALPQRTPDEDEGRGTKDESSPTARVPLICSVGLERRDYPTLMRAVRDLDVRAIIAAASPWSKQADSTERTEIPSNVTVRRFTQYELRQVYAESAFMVMPLYNVEFQAGVTAILEAMAMERAVICSRTAGQTDIIVEGETGLYVPPGDPQALRQAIAYLLNHPDEAQRMGRNGRRVVEERMSLERYVGGLVPFVRRKT